VANERAISLLGAIPADRLLTETDAPFGQIGERPSQPWDVIQTASALQNLLSLHRETQLKSDADGVLRFVGLIN
jgi:TatD DNase family protein